MSEAKIPGSTNVDGLKNGFIELDTSHRYLQSFDRFI